MHPVAGCLIRLRGVAVWDLHPRTAAFLDAVPGGLAT